MPYRVDKYGYFCYYPRLIKYMRIAIIGSKGIPARSGGIERHVEELSTRLVKQGFDVTVYSREWYTGKTEDFHKRVRIQQSPSVKTKHLDAITHTFMATIHAMSKGYDIYHFQGVGPSLLAWMPRVFRPSARVVATFHCLDRRQMKWGFWARRVLRFGEFAACKFAHETIVVSKTLAHYAHELYGCRANYIPNGITPSNRKLPVAKTLKKFSLTKERYVVMVTRLTPQKGIHLLVEAWLKMKASTEDLRVHGMKLVIVGDASFNDEYVAALKEQAKGHKDIVYTGLRTGDELHALMAGSAFAAHPSETEGLPISVLEKMSHGKAVLTSDIPEHLEIIEGKGYTFKLGNVNDLMLQLFWMITHPRACEKMGARAKKHVQAFYNWDSVAVSTAEVYRTLDTKPLNASRSSMTISTASRYLV